MDIMLANSYNGYLEYPVYCQPKIDGIRCRGGYSRQGNKFTTIDHIYIEDHFDGELIHNGGFLKTCSLVKRKDPIPDCREIEYRIYDLAIPGTFSERLSILQSLNVNIVETVLIYNEIQLQEYYNNKLDEGYEGIMIRNPKGLYKNGRSNDLLKYKPKQDSEYTIQGIIEGKGKLKGHAGYIQLDGFKAAVGGDYKSRLELFNNRDKYIGKYATIEYQGLSKYGIPRFPVFKGIRDYE